MRIDKKHTVKHARFCIFLFLAVTLLFAASCEKEKQMISIVNKKTVKTAEGRKKLLTVQINPSTILKLVYVKGGCYRMGNRFDDGDRDEKPVHEVCVDDFYMGKYEVTQGQWKAIRGDNPSQFQAGANYPVEQVSWSDVQEFITKLNKQTGSAYRLPTEAEWEYAARSGGRRDRFAGTSAESDLAQYANFCDINCEDPTNMPEQDDKHRTTAPVGRYKPNRLGLYDMSGNVWEFVQDWFDEGYYKKSPKANPQGPESGQKKVIRGGAWDYSARHVRAADRDGIEPTKRSNNGGFRLVLPIARQ